MKPTASRLFYRKGELCVNGTTLILRWNQTGSRKLLILRKLAFRQFRVALVQFLILLLYFVRRTMYAHPPERVRFGAFELDLSTGELGSIEGPLPDNPGTNNKVLLREQVLQVLRMLVEREGKIVTREEIKSRLWGDETNIDFDQGINSTIKALRRALGDAAGRPRYIETLGRRGYRLMPTIEYPEAAPGTALETDREQCEQPAT